MSSSLVTMVMPTFNRARYAATALRCFMQQAYSSVELVVVDDSTDYDSLRMPDDSRIRYIKLSHRASTGTKRNIGAEAARGEIIASLDDDDWSSPHRLEDQVRRLHATGKAVTGYNVTISWDESTGLFYRNAGGPPYYASGTSQCYLKSWWKQHPFPDATYGEDSVFSRTARLADQLAIADPGRLMVARKHAGNTDIVNIARLGRHSGDLIHFEFYRAVQSSLPGDLYITEPHACTLECRAEAERQFQAPVVQYRVASLPVMLCH